MKRTVFAQKLREPCLFKKNYKRPMVALRIFMLLRDITLRRVGSMVEDVIEHAA